MSMFIGEALVGEGNEIAHIDLLIGDKAGPVGHAFTPGVTGSVAAHFLGDVAGGTVAVAMGETAVSGTAGGLRMLETRFRQLSAAFTASRVAWFAEFLRKHLLGNLHVELQAAAALADSPKLREIEACLARLAGRIP